MNLSGVQAVVLDEADEMFDMGFADDLEALLAATPRPRQTMLFSATMPPHVDGVARRHLTDPVQIRLAQRRVEPGEAPARQTAYVVARPYKLTALGRVLDVEAPTAALVFCRTRTEVDELAVALAAGATGRRRCTAACRRISATASCVSSAGTADLIIATDVAARGLDVGHLSHVINYHVPSRVDAYVHRIGRVGRAGREGVAITLAEPRAHRLLQNIERTTGQHIDMARLPTVADLPRGGWS